MKKLASWFRIVISIVLLALLLHQIDLNRVMPMLSGARLLPILAVIGVAMLDRAIMALKWRILVAAIGVRLPVLECLRAYFVSSFCGLFLPSSVGGDVMRLMILDVDKSRREEVAASIVVERVVGLLSLLFLLTVSASLLLWIDPSRVVLMVLVVAMTLFLAGLVFMVVSLRWTRGVTPPVASGASPGFIRKLVIGYGSFHDKSPHLFRFFLLSVFENLFPIAANYLVCVALGIHVSALTFFVVIPASLLFARLPISVDGIGIQEGLYVVLFHAAGVGSEQAFSMALLARVLTTLALLPGGVLMLSSALRERLKSAASADVPRHNTLGMAFLVTLLVWLLFSWPLPSHVLSAVPSTAHRDLHAPAVAMMHACDQLQLMYHFWLVNDMIAGHTDFLYNTYEFNSGNDAERYQPSTYFFPFSLLYGAGQWMAGRAFGMNLSAFVSLWLTYYFTWRLLRRYGRDDTLLALAALPSLYLPYRWHSLLGGSPTGLAMMLIPIIFYGLDLAVRDDRKRGGLLAGVCIMLSNFSDTHVYFFVTLCTPLWCVLAIINRPDFEWSRVRAYRRVAVALLPVAALTALSLWMSTHLSQKAVGAGMKEGRTPVEVKLYSPLWNGFFSPDSPASSQQLYVGVVITALVLLGGVVMFRRRRHVERRTQLTWVLCFVAVIGIGCLSLGFNGPLDGAALKLARKLVPQYSLIRQTAKVLCLLPTLLCMLMALGLPLWIGRVKSRGWRVGWMVFILICMTAELASRIHPSVFKLEREQGAYQAVAEDAAKRSPDNPLPHVVVIVLWPGDSHASSMYQYYSSLYRVKMVNGYSPFVSTTYLTNVYQRLLSVNLGVLDDAQMDWLRQRGIEYVLLHEDMFPENVSPFPVGFALRNLLANPRLTLLKRSGATWAFRVEKTPASDRTPAPQDHGLLLPARRWQAERCAMTNMVVMADSNAAYGAHVVLDKPGSMLSTPTNGLVPADGMRFMLRVRGTGALDAQMWVGENRVETYPLYVQTREWTWLTVPMTELFRGYQPVQLKLVHREGMVDVDMLLLTAGAWNWNMTPGESVTVRAIDCFRAGHTDVERGEIVFEPTDRMGIVFYGPKLPLAPGRYRAEMEFSSDAEPGATLGELFIDRYDDRETGRAPVVAGQPVLLHWTQQDNLPVHLVFHHSERAMIRIRRLIFTRLE